MLASDLLTAVRSESSRTNKLYALKSAFAGPTGPFLKKFVRYALEPTLTFNVGKTTVDASRIGAHGSDAIGLHDFEMLDQLAQRKMTRSTGGSWASDRVSRMRPAEAEAFICLLDKDLAWGIGASSINEAIPGFLTEFHCMLAAKYEASDLKFPVYVEPKYDGMRVLAIVEDKIVRFYTRSGKDVNSLPQSISDRLLGLAADLSEDGAIVFDGEVMGDSFKETMEKARRKSEVFEDARYYVFDWLSRETFSTIGKRPSTLTYNQRRVQLQSATRRIGPPSSVILPPAYIASSEEEVSHYYNTFRDSGLEGAIVKAFSGPYVGKRSPYWMKLKGEETLDLKIVSMVEGEGKYVGMLGALVVDHNGVLVNVGTGLSDDDRSLFWSNQSLYINKLVEVQFQEVTPDGSLRHPRYLRMRMDKSEW